MASCNYKIGDMIDGRYRVVSDFSDCAGGSWGFVLSKPEGKELFIKRFKAPTLPSGVKLNDKHRKKWEDFGTRIRNINRALSSCSSGGVIVTAIDFFSATREAGKGRHWFKVCQKITPSPKQNDIHRLPDDCKLLTLQTAAFGINELHQRGIVHLDIKPANVMCTDYRNSEDTMVVSRIIDFDDSIFDGDAPDRRITGDPEFYAPENGLYQNATSSPLPSKPADVFSLGLVFCQYWFGKLPVVRPEDQFVWSAILRGHRLQIPATPRNKPDQMVLYDPDKAPETDRKIHFLIKRMLSRHPNDRPSIQEVHAYLCDLHKSPTIPEPPKLKRMKTSSQRRADA